MEKKIIDIVSDCGYPGDKLSNFNEYEFNVDGVNCNSMEGFLQSLKFDNPEKQKEICLLVGKKAKFKGKKKKWWLTQKLQWNGVIFDRHSTEYQRLLDKAFHSLAKNKTFQKVLLDTENYQIRHSIGKENPYETILTEKEFCTRLMNIREELKKQTYER